MPFIVCDECGTKNELQSAGDTYVYCRACANRIELRPETDASAASAPESNGSNDLLDELLSMPLAAPHHAAHAPEPEPEPEPPVAEASTEIAPTETEVAAAPEAQTEPHAEAAAPSGADVALTESTAGSNVESVPAIAINASTEPAALPITATETAAQAIAEVVITPPAVVETAAAQIEAPVPMPVAAPAPVAAAVPVAATRAPVPAAVPRPFASPAEPKQRRSQPPPLPATELVAAPVIPIAQSTPEPEAKPAPSALEVALRNIEASAQTYQAPTAVEAPREIAVEPAPAPEASVSNAAPAAAAPSRDSLDELSWELPSPMPPIALELERPASDATVSAALAPQPAIEPALSEPALSEPALIEQTAAAPALGEQTGAAPALSEPALEQTAAAQALGEPLVAAPSITIAVPPVAVPGTASAEAPFTTQQPVRELPHVATEPANIRATLPFGPTLPSPETVPGIVADIVVAPVAATTANTAAASATPATEPARVEPAARSTAAAAAIAQAAEATPPMLSRPFFEPSVRTTSDAPTTHSWPPDAASPSKLRRYAPLAAALVAVAVAFVGGIQVGKMSPDSKGPTVAAAAPLPPAPRPPVAEVAAPPTATSLPASAGTPTQTEPAAAPATKGGHTGLVALKPSGGFSAKVANAALGQVTGRARACKKPGSVGGTALAMVTFGPSGRVEDVTVSGARFAGTPMATCIASALSAARVPPFTGSAQTVKRAVKID